MARRPLIHERLTRSVIGAFYEVYNTLGFGFLEHIYILALEIELRARGHRVRRKVWVPVYCKGHLLKRQRIDMVVDDVLVVELKATAQLATERIRQVHNYLAATDFEVSLFLHFGLRPKFFRAVSPSALRTSVKSGVSV